MKHARVLLLGFLVGAAGMAAELLGPRLVAPQLGTGLLTWSAIIATFLGGMALGNRVGGRLADRNQRFTLPAVLALAAVLVLATIWLGDLAALLFAGIPHGLRVPLVVGLTFLPAAFALGLPTPLLAKAVLGLGRSPGRALGSLAAAGALGSVAGTFLTGFALIPAYGTRALLFQIAAWLGGSALLAGSVRIGTRHPADGEAASTARRTEPGAAGPGGHRFALLAAIAGFALLAMELVAGRVAAIHLGTSVYTWTAVIGVVLVGLSLGNVIGGRLADRYPPVQLLGTLFLIASAAVATGLWTPNLMAGVAEGGGPWILRVALAVAVAFLLPALAVGTLSPVIARAALGRPETDGQVVGRIYAWGTLGAIAGAALSPYILIPMLSLPVLLIGIAFVLALAAIPLRRRLELPWLATLVILALLVRLPVDSLRTLGNRLGLREDVSGVYVDDSQYFHIVVSPYTREGPPPERAPATQRLRYMALDRLVHGFVDLDDPMWLEYEYEQLYAAIVERLWPEATAEVPARTCFIGGGTYTYQRRLLAQHHERVRVTTLEIDPAVTKAAKRALGLENDPRHTIVHTDARTWLGANEATYDFIFGDAFHDVGVPWHLTTRECTALIKSRLRTGERPGVYLVNIVDIYDSGRFLRAFLETLKTSFANIELLSMGPRKDGERQTFIIAASDGPLRLAGLEDDAGAPLPAIYYATWPGGPQGAGLLTDDHAPVEALLAPVIEKRRMKDER